MKKRGINFILTLPGFSIDGFSKKVSLDDWEVMSLSEFVQMRFWGILRFLRSRRFSNFVIGRRSIEEERIRIFIEGVLFLARGNNKKIIDNFGNEKKIGLFKFSWDLTKFVFELFLDVIFVLCAYIAVFLTNFYLRVPYKVKKIENKKIVFLRTDYFGEQKTGGSFTHAQGFISGAVSLGWDVFAIAQNKFFEDGARFYRIPYVAFHNSPEIPEILYTYKYIWRAAKIIKKEKPAFFYHRHSFLNASSIFLKRFFKIPLILEYNGSEPWVREKWGGKLFLKNLAYYFENSTLKGADYIGVVSEVLREDLLARGIDARKIIVNPNGVEIDKFRPDLDGQHIRKKYGWGDTEIVAGFLGTFGAWHGVEVLAAGIKKIVSGNKNIKFLMIGDGSLRPMVEKILSDDGVKDYVALPGIVSHEEVPFYLAACDMLVSPHIPNKDGTKFFGSPTKLFEYMAMGKGIVASDLEQIGKVLEHNKTAWLVKPGDLDELAAGVLKLAEDKNLRNRLGGAAYNEASEKYTWKENARRIIEAYQSI